MVSSATQNVCGNKPASIGVMTHELIHTWGVPDLYDSTWLGKGTGNYDIMSNPFGWNGRQTHPHHMGPWSRMRCGFLDPIEIDRDGDYPIEASGVSNQVYIIRANYPEGEYLLIENRQQVEYESEMPGSGLLIWHIDDSMNMASMQKTRGYPGQEGWPWNGNHYQVAILQADGSYHLEKNENAADGNDFFTKGDELNAGTSVHPNSNAYKNGDIVSTGIRIYDISDSARTMNFRVSGLGIPVGSPTTKPSAPPSSIPSSPPTHGPPSVSPSMVPSTSPSASPTVQSESLTVQSLASSSLSDHIKYQSSGLVSHYAGGNIFYRFYDRNQRLEDGQ